MGMGAAHPTRGIFKAMKHTTLDLKTAWAQGYRPITIVYELPVEQWMLDRAMADQLRGGIDVVTVPMTGGVEIWKRGPKHIQPIESNP